ncbi:Alcohol dehydrogenase, class IV [Salinibacillus kushneri]|uniref:Alcohol dehydrogenase, class IV n=1 Tax=Salinibacillus kushneri TaxID=237682 RepID=A0A1H9YH14_9BACI|nr:iron-containing alcohol dehydrogenase [Salinibacillus kushneri]SES68236.1 Alcohol dehydrogenase, class IV [Salinibacillus kushneri]
MYKMFCRIYQAASRIFTRFLPWREPVLLEGENSLGKLPPLLKRKHLTKVLIVTDEGIRSIGLMDNMLKELREEGIKYVIYDKVVPNPTIENIETALKIFKESNCKGIISFGGGSPMDCAKGVGARIARPGKTLPQLKGLLRVRKETPPLVAVPTTAGTGSEATVATVISNPDTHEKYAIMDLSLIPDFAVLDPLLTKNLPPHITSTTGMDALTHAVEAYTNHGASEKAKRCSREAVKLIFENLYEAYSNGKNMEARTNMQRAAYVAGVAFTRAYVGNVHAIAHTLGGFYAVPHGLANAVILPHVLEYYGRSVYPPLADLADLVNIGDPSDDKEQKAKKFIEEIKNFNKKMNIPDKISGIKEKDLSIMIKRALSEANPIYPVPKIFSEKDMEYLYHVIQE